MASLEEYIKKNTDIELNEFREAEIDKGVNINKSSYDYDPDQLIEHLNKKISDKSPEAFAKRTRYYFTDSLTMTAKSSVLSN